MLCGDLKGKALAWTLFLLGLLTALLCASAATPWYYIQGTNWPKPDETRSFYLWWNGFHYDAYVHTQTQQPQQPQQPHQQILHESGLMRWEELPSLRLKDVYLSSVTLIIFCLVLAFVYLLIFLGITVASLSNSPGEIVSEGLGGDSRIRATVHFGAGGILICVCISWFVFMTFLPPALSEAHMCSDEKNKWCENFMGATLEGPIHVAWVPHVGWVSAFLSTIPAALLMVSLHVLLRRPKSLPADMPIEIQKLLIIQQQD
jgi:hypothetical protein